MRFGFSADFGWHVAASVYGESDPFGYWVVSARMRAVAAVLGVGLNQEGILPLMQSAGPAREGLLSYVAARQYRWPYRVAGISASTANNSLQADRP